MGSASQPLPFTAHRYCWAVHLFSQFTATEHSMLAHFHLLRYVQCWTKETRFLQKWTNNDTCRQFQVLAGTSRPLQWGDLIGKNGSVDQPLQPRWSKVPLRGNRDLSPRVRSQPCHRLQKKPRAEALRMDRSRKKVCGPAMVSRAPVGSYIWKCEQGPHHALAVYNKVLASSSEWDRTPSQGLGWKTYLLF